MPPVKAGALGVGPASPWARLLGTVPRGVFLSGKPVSRAPDLLPLCCVSSVSLSRLPFLLPLPWFSMPTVTEALPDAHLPKEIGKGQSQGSF